MVARVYGLPIKLAILNNQFLGMVRQWQEMFHENRYSQVSLEAAPDFVKLAEAYDCVGLRCERIEDVEATLQQAMAITDRPVVMDFRVAKETNVYPMIPSGQTIHDMVITRPKNGQEPSVQARLPETSEAVTAQTVATAGVDEMAPFAAQDTRAGA
jgi:acetolactate synthase-1/2/3 large subunit